jgi:hypothetical protein
MDGLAAPRELVGQVIDGRYHLLRAMGHEGQVEVYEAEDERLERRVALHLLDEGAADAAALGASRPDELLDAGDHEGRAFVVLPLVGAAPTASTGEGDDDPTEELAVPADPTAVLPLPLVPDPPEEPVAPVGTGAPRTIAAALWTRRALVLGALAVLLVLVLVGLSARGDGVDVPTDASVPVSSETTTTLAPATSTTAAPTTTEAPAPEESGQGKGKGKKGDDDD